MKHLGIAMIVGGILIIVAVKVKPGTSTDGWIANDYGVGTSAANPQGAAGVPGSKSPGLIAATYTPGPSNVNGTIGTLV